MSLSRGRKRKSVCDVGAAARLLQEGAVARGPSRMTIGFHPQQKKEKGVPRGPRAGESHSGDSVFLADGLRSKKEKQKKPHSLTLAAALRRGADPRSTPASDATRAAQNPASQGASQRGVRMGGGTTTSEVPPPDAWVPAPSPLPPPPPPPPPPFSQKKNSLYLSQKNKIDPNTLSLTYDPSPQSGVLFCSGAWST